MKNKSKLFNKSVGEEMSNDKYEKPESLVSRKSFTSVHWMGTQKKLAAFCRKF